MYITRMYVMIHYQTKFHNDSNSSLVYCHQQKAKEMFQQYHIISLHSTNKITINKAVSTHDMMVYRERRAITPAILNFGNSWRWVVNFMLWLPYSQERIQYS